MGRIEKRRSSTLGGVFMRYVLVVLGALFILGASIILMFSILINTGYIHPANYAEQKINEKYELIRNADEVTEDMIPPLCHYVIFSLDGKKLSGNMAEDSLEIAWNAAENGKASGRYFYKVISRPDEYVVLQYSLTPQYNSAFLREHLINPQSLFAIMLVLGTILIIIFLSIRFGKKMKAKMMPMMNAVGRIKEKDLEYEVTCYGIKEFDDCLESIDEMRIALKDSLEQQWKTEQDKNRQMSALAHDIKTPLTVVRGNAELLSETELTEEQKKNVDYIINSTLQIQSYVQKLIEVTRSAEISSYASEKVKTEAFLKDIRMQAAGLAEVYHLKMNWREKWDSETINVTDDQVTRAVMNIIQNAVEHTMENGVINIYAEEQDGKLSFTVEDTGSGFTKEALQHGTEQFFMDDTSRSSGNHYGIGLFSAQTIAEKYDGNIFLTNSEKTGGAKVKICFHLRQDNI